MKPERILVPIEVEKCPLEVFKVVNGFAQRPGATVILLHVVALNIAAPENRIYAELAREADWHLKRLALECVPADTATRIRVRLGKPVEEILAIAEEEGADLMVLPMRRAPVWKRFFAPFFPKTVVKLIRDAPCTIFAVEVKTRFNGVKNWGRPVKEIRLAPERLPKPAPSKPVFSPAAGIAWTPGSHPDLARAHR